MLTIAIVNKSKAKNENKDLQKSSEAYYAYRKKYKELEHSFQDQFKSLSEKLLEITNDSTNSFIGDYSLMKCLDCFGDKLQKELWDLKQHLLNPGWVFL